MKLKHVTLISVFVLSIIMIFRWIIELHEFKIDSITLTLLFVGIGIAFIPFATQINIFGILKIKILESEIMQLAANFYKGKVAKTESGEDIYIDSNGIYHELPDAQTINFLIGQEGILDINKKELKNFKKGKKFESVLNSKYVIWDAKAGQQHQFTIFNNKKYHVTSASFFADWGWEGKKPEPITIEELQHYETGK